MTSMKADNLEIRIFDNRQQMGLSAAQTISACIRKKLKKQNSVRIIFAAAPSQNEVLRELFSDTEIDFGRIEAFHMDEYVWLPESDPHTFHAFLDQYFSRVKMKRVFYIDEIKEKDRVCTSYTEKLFEKPVDIVILGIGENGHLAFNDPEVAAFQDPEAMKIVRLDEVCRMQQVHDGCFASMDKVPTHAYTLTLPSLMRPEYKFCIVPNVEKAEAVCKVVNGPVTESCPASILRTASNAMLFLDQAAASKL